MRRVMGAVGTVILEILKWILRIILGALKLVLGPVSYTHLCQNNSSSIRYGGKDISFIRKNGHILRGGELMQVKGLFLNYKKNRRLMQYFFKIRELV